MKAISVTFFVVSILSSCYNPSPNIGQQIEAIKESVAEAAEKHNKKIILFNTLIDHIYTIADTNLNSAIRLIDKELDNTTLDDNERLALRHIKGEIYYKMDSLELAIAEFSVGAGPRSLIARAEVFVKTKQYGRAYIDLEKAALLNYDYLWNIGNYYEIVGMKDYAAVCYKELYSHDTSIYSFCKIRIDELKKDKPQLLTELVLRKKERVYVLLQGVK